MKIIRKPNPNDTVVACGPYAVGVVYDVRDEARSRHLIEMKGFVDASPDAAATPDPLAEHDASTAEAPAAEADSVERS